MSRLVFSLIMNEAMYRVSGVAAVPGGLPISCPLFHCGHVQIPLTIPPIKSITVIGPAFSLSVSKISCQIIFVSLCILSYAFIVWGSSPQVSGSRLIVSHSHCTQTASCITETKGTLHLHCSHKLTVKCSYNGHTKTGLINCAF